MAAVAGTARPIPPRPTAVFRIIVAALSLLFAASLARADCTSFLKKCKADAKAAMPANSCAAMAKEKKLAGAAKSSFMKKCEKDAAK